jgi:hypothetical protein
VERRGEVELTLPLPTTRYFDQFLRMRCRQELSENELFPNAKELTESFAAADAALYKVDANPRDGDMTAVIIGDGSTPRTAATIALRSSWRVLSVDPALRVDTVRSWPLPIERLDVRAVRVEALSDRLTGRCIVVAVHAHVELARAIRSVERCGAEVVGAVAVPCCGWTHDAPGLAVVADYEDWGIWSPERRVIAWAR